MLHGANYTRMVPVDVELDVAAALDLLGVTAPPPGPGLARNTLELATWGSVDVSRYAHRSGGGHRAETNERPERGRVSER